MCKITGSLLYGAFLGILFFIVVSVIGGIIGTMTTVDAARSALFFGSVMAIVKLFD
jgi:hypothetical protein